VANSATCYLGVGADTVIADVHLSDGHVLCP
jgi:hypothetical protein